MSSKHVVIQTRTNDVTGDKKPRDPRFKRSTDSLQGRAKSKDKSSSVSPENPRKKKLKFDDETQLNFNFSKYTNHITKGI